MKSMLSYFLALFMYPLTLSTNLGGAISGIWLLILGDWITVLYGIVGYVVSGFGLVFLMAPILRWTNLCASNLAENGRKGFSHLFFFIGTAYSNIVVAAWCIFVLFFLTNNANNSSFIPSVILSYSVATYPLLSVAVPQIERRGGDFSLISMYLAQLAAMLVIILVIFFNASINISFYVFGVTLLVAILSDQLEAPEL